MHPCGREIGKNYKLKITAAENWRKSYEEIWREAFRANFMIR